MTSARRPLASEAVISTPVYTPKGTLGMLRKPPLGGGEAPDPDGSVALNAAVKGPTVRIPDAGRVGAVPEKLTSLSYQPERVILYVKLSYSYGVVVRSTKLPLALFAPPILKTSVPDFPFGAVSSSPVQGLKQPASKSTRAAVRKKPELLKTFLITYLLLYQNSIVLQSYFCQMFDMWY
jgi:hypothetical protein